MKTIGKVSNTTRKDDTLNTTIQQAGLEATRCTHDRPNCVYHCPLCHACFSLPYLYLTHRKEDHRGRKQCMAAHEMIGQCGMFHHEGVYYNRERISPLRYMAQRAKEEYLRGESLPCGFDNEPEEEETNAE